MPDSTSPLKYHSVEELQNLSVEELAALVDQLPTERVRSYKLQYDRWLRQQGVATTVGSDSLEKDILLDLLNQYGQSGLVPAGDTAWVKVPPLTQERARLNEGLPPAQGTTTAKRVNPAFVIGGLAVPLVCVVMLLFSRGHKTDNPTALQGTRTPTRTPSATPANSPTPTPLALENQDK